MPRMDLKKEIKDARKELDPMAREIKGLGFFGMSLQNTKTMADYYVENLSNLKHEACMAFTKAIIVDYGRLWKKTNNKFIDRLDKGFFPTNAPVHDELLQLRDKLVAHPDKGFESLALRVGGLTVVNESADSNTHGSVFVTLNTRIEVIGAMWWVKDIDTAKRIRDHISTYHRITYEKLRDVARKFIFSCQRRAHVLKELDDLFSIRDFVDQGRGQRRRPDISEGPIHACEPKELKIGRTNLVGTIGIYESGDHISSDKVKGLGFTIEFRNDGKLNVTFPFHTTET